MSDRRLIEAAFPLKQASIDAVHEKNVRHGHISTLHIWPARRPLAASRAALLATLLRDPGDPRSRRDLVRRIGGEIVEEPGPDGRMREKTKGGVLHWGRENERAAESGIGFFREEIRKAFGGRAPRVLDPFAGGGAIPLEAMRLGCEVVASDLSPVAWFILRCTLHHPHQLAGQVRPLPDFALHDRELMTAFVKAHGAKTPTAVRKGLAAFGFTAGAGGAAKHGSQSQMPVNATAETDFAWHFRAWGREVLRRVRRSLADRYPTYADFEPVRSKGRAQRQDDADVPNKPRQRLEPDAEGAVSAAKLNSEFDRTYLKDKGNPRWIAKPTVAYLWTRTVACASCRKEVPLLKTRWLCRKDDKRIRLVLVPTEAGVDFDIEEDVPRDADAGGTMSDSGATCPSCGVTATMADLRAAGRAGRLGERMTAVVVAGQGGKEYRLPTDRELEAANVDEATLEAAFGDIPFGLPDEPTPDERSLGMRVPRYGFDTWRKLFADRQLLALATVIHEARRALEQLHGDPEAWHEPMISYLAAALSRMADRGSCLATWTNNPETIRSTFARFALPMVWDFAESCPLTDTTGGLNQAIEWIARVVEHLQAATEHATREPSVVRRSAVEGNPEAVDVICTDPPYYDAIPYSDLMDFFYVWLRRILRGQSPEIDDVFAHPLGPKWDSEADDGELIDDAARFNGDRAASKRNYENGMVRAFSRFHDALRDDGRLVIVFANKSPDAWETLVSALIRAGFVVDASWPIQTEMQTRQRSLGSAALASSIWLVCKKRLKTARPGWDNRVLADMQTNITEQLREFWDAGIRGPDFVWAATGPALEAFSRHPVVKRSDAPGEILTVTSFLRHVRRMVAAFVVRRLFGDDAADSDELDDPTTYYLLHRSDFGLGRAPAGACILYAVSCNLADSDLAGRLDLLARGGKARNPSTDDDAPQAETKGSEVRLKPWDRRRAKDLGEPMSDGQPPPLIDRLHRLMRLWKAADLTGVDAYLDNQALVAHDLFARVVQAVIELADAGSEERATLELIQNHLATQGGTLAPRTGRLI